MVYIFFYNVNSEDSIGSIDIVTYRTSFKFIK